MRGLLPFFATHGGATESTNYVARVGRLSVAFFSASCRGGAGAICHLIDLRSPFPQPATRLNCSKPGRRMEQVRYSYFCGFDHN